MPHHNVPQQQGAILFLALIMLLLITVIGTSSIGLTTLDTRMTANARDQQSAFQTSEVGLLAAESILIPSEILPKAGITAGYLEDLPPQWWATIPSTWDSGAAVPSTDNRVSTTYIINKKAVFAIDEFESIKNISADQSLGERLFYYTVTSRGIGPGGAPILLQSLFARKTEATEL
jgi:type IV pilus assembly protein PilX